MINHFARTGGLLMLGLWVSNLVIAVGAIIGAFLPMKFQQKYCSTCKSQTQQFMSKSKDETRYPVDKSKGETFNYMKEYTCDICGNKTVDVFQSDRFMERREWSKAF
jgi:hypothetical protein